MKVRNIVIFLVLFAVAGYLRERFFEHMNIIMAGVYRGTNVYEDIGIQAPSVMKGFMSWSYTSLYYSKYAFTILWTLVFLMLSYFALRTITQSRFLLRILFISYGVLFVLAAVSMVYGYVTTGKLNNDEYTLSRWLMGIAQSPIICLILTASEQLYKKSFSHDTKG